MQFKRVTSKSEASKLARCMPKVIAVDTEYSEVDVKKAKLLSVVISNGEVSYSFGPELLPEFTPAMERARLLFMQNHVVDVLILGRYGCDLSRNEIFDTMLAHHLINENLEHGLSSMVKLYFNDNYKDEFWTKYKSFEEAPEEESLTYECKDGYYTYRLGMMFAEQLRGK